VSIVSIPSALAVAVRLIESRADAVVRGVLADEFKLAETVFWDEFSTSRPDALVHGARLTISVVEASWSLHFPVSSGWWMTEVRLEEIVSIVALVGVVGNDLTSSPSALVGVIVPVISA